MAKYLEESLRRDIERIRGKITDMASLADRALRDCVTVLEKNDRQLAYSIIIRDRRIDDLEKEIDRLCLEFLVRQQPIAGPLRFVYATIKINLELERVGDYAESIARQSIKLIDLKVPTSSYRFAEMANLSIPMLRDAIRAFLDQNAELAAKTAEVEIAVDVLRGEVNQELFKHVEQKKVPLEALTPLVTIARRFERVSDQAKNICEEVAYMCTGEYAKHQGGEVFRILFVDDANEGLSQMAEAIGNSSQSTEFLFSSAGLRTGSPNPAVLQFLEKNGLAAGPLSSKTISQVPNLDHYHVVIGLVPEAKRIKATLPAKALYLDWTIPGLAAGSEDELKRSFEFLQAHINDLVKAICGETTD